MPTLRIQLFDVMRVEYRERELRWLSTHNVARLLGYLAYHLRTAHPREVLMETFWPNSPDHAARSSLTSALWTLRCELRDLGIAAGSLLESDRRTVRLVPHAVSTDVDEFDQALSEAWDAVGEQRTLKLKCAADLYRGELLRGQLDAWIQPEQRRLLSAYDRAITELCALNSSNGDLENALHYATAGLRADPTSEPACLRLMRLYMAAGQPRVALEQYYDFARHLRAELETLPGADLNALAIALAKPAAAWSSGFRSDLGEAELDHLTEPAGGVVSPNSAYYVSRAPDRELIRALQRGENLLLLKGPRQTGKSSLLVRGIQQARKSGARAVLTDLDVLSDDQLATLDGTLFALAESLADELELEVRPRTVWDADRGPMLSLRHYLKRHVLGSTERPLMWALDGLDRLFPRPFGSRVFALFRAWYNERSLDPESVWGRLTLAMAYSAEAHLFISDVNQSPFNVGRRLELTDFDPLETAELNQRHASPLSDLDLRRLRRLLGGHPYLIRLALTDLQRKNRKVGDLEREAVWEDGPFGEHLRRLRQDIGHDPEVAASVAQIVRTGQCANPRVFYRLRSAGLVTGMEPQRASFRCELYGRYLREQLLRVDG